MLLITFLIIFMGCSGFSNAFDFSSIYNLSSLSPVSEVDLSRYQGVWYEIARMPFFFERNCYCSMTKYSLNLDGTVEVQNICNWNAPDGKLVVASAVALPSDPIEGTITSGKLQVSFVSLFSGPYWILAIDNEYQYSLVGTPFLDNMWILARNPTIEDDIYYNLLNKARNQGIDVSKVIKTYQGPECSQTHQHVKEKLYVN